MNAADQKAGSPKDPRVEAALNHWAPRFVANGVPLADFQEVTAEIHRWEEWCEAWCARGRVHEALAEEAIAAGHRAAITEQERPGVFTLRVGNLMAGESATVRLSLVGPLPPSARPDLSVDGTIELERLNDVLKVGRPAFGQANQTIGMFVLTPDGSEAVRTTVKLGRNSVSTIEIIDGLKEGDKVIISDTSALDSYNRIRIR